jgi:hypothetical protein
MDPGVRRDDSLKNHASTGSPCRRRAMAHSASPGMQVRQTSGRTA